MKDTGEEGGREGGLYLAKVGERVVVEERVRDQQLEKTTQEDVEDSAGEA